MALRRHTRDSILGFGTRFGTARAIRTLRNSIALGVVDVDRVILREGDRLDTVAGRVYGDGRLWWVIAAASSIGWALQAPPGTVLLVPRIRDVARVVG